MIKIMTAAERHTSQKECVQSEYSFSFAEYDDPHNAHFGSLLAHNDHILQPGGMFDPELHHDLEIVNIVLEGNIQYEDENGKERLEPGSVQVVSTGRGLTHREKNDSDTEDARFIQMWFLPNQPDITSTRHQKTFERDQQKNGLLPLVSGRDGEAPLSIALDTIIYGSVLETGTQVNYSLAEGRRVHVYLIKGNIEISCEDGSFDLTPGDAARLQGCDQITLKGTSSDGDAELILIDLP